MYLFMRWNMSSVFSASEVTTLRRYTNLFIIIIIIIREFSRNLTVTSLLMNEFFNRRVVLLEEILGREYIKRMLREAIVIWEISH